jgi:flagellar biosynthesis chaperone FliJ
MIEEEHLISVKELEEKSAEDNNKQLISPLRGMNKIQRIKTSIISPSRNQTMENTSDNSFCRLKTQAKMLENTVKQEQRTFSRLKTIVENDNGVYGQPKFSPARQNNFPNLKNNRQTRYTIRDQLGLKSPIPRIHNIFDNGKFI